MDNWSKLPLRKRAELISLYVDGGVINIEAMKNHYNSFDRGGRKGGWFKKTATPSLPEWDQDFVDNQIEENQRELDYNFERKVAQENYNSNTPADRYYNRMGIYDKNAKSFLSNMYSARKSMFPGLDTQGINTRLQSPYSYYDAPTGEAGYYSKTDGVNYASPNDKTMRSYMGDVPTHERTHSLQMTDQEKAIQDFIDNSYQDYEENGKPYYGFLREGVQYNPYLDNPAEIYARRNAFLKYLSDYGTSYSGVTKDGRRIDDFTPDFSSPVGGRWIEALKSNGNAKNIDTFQHSPEMYEDEYFNGEEPSMKTNSFLERYSPEFIMFLLNGVAQNRNSSSMPANTNIAAYGKDLKGSYTPSKSIKDYIKNTEAFRSKWYLDGNGVPTVGYGFTGEYFKKKYPNGMTKEEADKEFDKVIDKFVGYVKQHTPNYDKMTQNQKDALLSYVYNIGPGNYQRSKNLQEALKKEDWNTAAKHINIGYNDKRNPGLRKRRDYERALFLNGVQWPFDDYQSTEEQKSPTYWYDEYMKSIGALPVATEVGTIAERPEEKLFNSNTPLSSFALPANYYTPSFNSKRQAVASNYLNASSIPSNEEILENLYRTLNYNYGNGNLFVDGGDEKNSRRIPSAGLVERPNGFYDVGPEEPAAWDDEVEVAVHPYLNLKPYKRKEVRKIAEEDVLSNAIRPEVGGKGQKRKARVYNRAYDRTKKQVEKQEHDKALKRAAVEELQTGVPTGAFEQYTREGIDEAAPLAMGIVGGAAAPWLLGNAALSGEVLDAIGKYAMPSALTKGAAYYLPAVAQEAAAVGQIGDAAALAYWTLKGAQGAREAAKEENYEQAAAEGALAALPMIPAAAGIAREGRKAWEASRDYRKDLADWFELNIGPTGIDRRHAQRMLKQEVEDVYALMNEYDSATRKARSVAESHLEYPISSIEKTDRTSKEIQGGINETSHTISYGPRQEATETKPTYETTPGGRETTETTSEINIPAGILGKKGDDKAVVQYDYGKLRDEVFDAAETPRLTTIKNSDGVVIWDPNYEVDNIHKPITDKGINELSNTVVIGKEPNGKELTFTRPMVKVNGTETTQQITERDPGILIPQGFDKDTGETAKYLKGYVEYIRSKIGDKGAATGSNILYSEGAVSGIPGDTEILTTKKNAQAVKDAIEFNHDLGSTNLVDEGHSPIALRSGKNDGKVDIQYIDEDANGNATGRIAWQMFRTMHPDEYAAQAAASVIRKKHFSSRAIINPNTGVPYTSEELLSEFNSGNHVLQYEVDNALGLLKHYDSNIAKQNRPLAILTSRSPKVQRAVRTSISNLGRAQVGDKYVNGSDLFNDLDFSNVEENKAFLKRFGLDGHGIEEDEEAMRNIFDYWYMQQSCQKRSVSDKTGNASVGDIRDWLFTSNFSRGGGDASGAGRNTISASKETMAFLNGYPYVGAMQTHLSSNPSKIRTLGDIAAQVDRTRANNPLSTEEVVNAANSLRDAFSTIDVNGFVVNSSSKEQGLIQNFSAQLLAATNNYELSGAIRSFAREAKNMGMKEADIEKAIDVVSKSLDIPFYSVNAYYTHFGTDAYKGILRKASDAGSYKYFDVLEGGNESPFEFGKDIEGYIRNATSSTYNTTPGNVKMLKQKDILELVPEENRELFEKIYNAKNLGELKENIELFSDRRDSYSLFDLPELIDREYLLRGEIDARLRRIRRKAKMIGSGKKYKKEIDKYTDLFTRKNASPRRRVYEYIEGTKVTPKLQGKNIEDFLEPESALPW